jgi:uncharacterized protein (TIGR00255 family)
MAEQNLLRSMTGYGRARGENHAAAIGVEVRCVNGRFFRMFAKLPPFLTCFEARLEKLVRASVRRGNIDLYLRYEPIARGGAASFDLSAVQYYREQLEQLRRQLGLAGEISIELLANLPGSLRNDDLSEEETEQLWPLVERVTTEALERVDEMRVVEGKALAEDLTARCERIRELLGAIRARVPAALEGYCERLHQRINGLLARAGVEITASDLAREVALFTERSDISEELARLDSHLEQFHKTVAEAADAGRRLEFLAQEIHREANTMGGKANDAELSKLIIEIKAEVDKIKEQVPNVE